MAITDLDDDSTNDEDSLRHGWEMYEKARCGRRAAGIWIEARAGNYYHNQATINLQAQSFFISPLSSPRTVQISENNLLGISFITGKNITSSSATTATTNDDEDKSNASVPLSTPATMQISRQAYFYQVIARTYKMLLLLQGGFWLKDPILAHRMGHELYPQLNAYYEECILIEEHHPHRPYLATLVGLCHYLGLGTPCDRTAAYSYFHYAAELAPEPLLYAQNTLASYYLFDDAPGLVTRNPLHAVRLLEKILHVQPTYHMALFNLSCIYSSNQYSPALAANKILAQGYLQKASDQGNVHALYLQGLSQIKSPHQPSRLGIVTLKRAMKNFQHDLSTFVLGRIFHIGISTFVKLPTVTSSLQLSGIAKGRTVAASLDEQKDWFQALKCYRFAAQQQYLPAQITLAGLLIDIMQSNFQYCVFQQGWMALSSRSSDSSATGGEGSRQERVGRTPAEAAASGPLTAIRHPFLIMIQEKQHADKVTELIFWLEWASRQPLWTPSPASEMAMMMLARWYECGYLAIMSSTYQELYPGLDGCLLPENFQPNVGKARELYKRVVEHFPHNKLARGKCTFLEEQSHLIAL